MKVIAVNGSPRKGGNTAILSKLEISGKVIGYAKEIKFYLSGIIQMRNLSYIK